MDNLNDDMVDGKCRVLSVMIDDDGTLSQDKWNAECAEIAANAGTRYLYLMKWFEFLNLCTMVRETISPDNARLKL